MKLRTLFPLIALALTTLPAAPQTSTSVRFSNTTPAAPAGTANVNFQHDNSTPISNISAYVVYPTLQVACPTSGDLASPINACLAALPVATGGTCDARACTAATTLTSTISITHPNTALFMPCATLTTANTITVAATAPNSELQGCAYSAGSPVSGSSAGTLINYTGSSTALQVGDATHANYTNGLDLRSFGISLVNAANGATALTIYAVERYRLDSLYISGNNTATQTGITIDGTGWYSSGLTENVTMQDIGTGYVLTGHLAGGTRNDYVNFSTFIQNQIWCADNNGVKISGTTGVSDTTSYGSTWIGGGTFRCSTPYNNITSPTGLLTFGFNVY